MIGRIVRVKVKAMNMYKRWISLLVVIVAVGASVPGCGKKDEEEAVNNGGGGGTSTVNGFSVNGGVGQAGILSENTCYNVTRNSDGSLEFPIATHPSDPHSYSGGYSNGGYLYAIAYVADRYYTGGNSYSAKNSYGDTLNVYISSDDLYFNGRVYLAPATVRDLLRYLGEDPSDSTVCIDGVVFQQVQVYGSSMTGYMTLWVDDYPVLNF